MSKKYLDDTGLSHFWDKIKVKISGDISAEAGKLIPYGYCTTAAKTATKTVTVSPTITAIKTGLTIAVKFQYANGVANPTLNVNGLGAHAIKRYGTTAPSTSAASSWNANEVRILVYDGTYWQTADWLNTTYSAMTVEEYEAGTATTSRLITPARLKGAIEHWATGEANVQSDWEQTDDTADDFIKNKPTIPTVPTNVSAFTNDAGYITGYTETDPVFTASPAHGITASDISNWNGKSDFSGSYNDLSDKPTIPTVPTKTSELTNDSGFVDTSTLNSYATIIGLSENYQSPVHTLVVNGSTATLYLNSTTPTPIAIFAMHYLSVAGVLVAQVLNGATDLSQAQARAYEVAEVDMTTASVRLVSVDNGVIYTADLQDTGNGLTGTFSSQTIPTGGITTETDPTVPAWAKASTKPSYTASEVGALASTGGEVTGDITLKSDAATNSKSVIFQRGTLTDNYNDWQIQDRGGFLYFDQRGYGSTSFANQVYFNTSGNVQATTFNGYTLAAACAKAVDASISPGSTSINIPTSQAVAALVSNIRELPAVTASDNGKVLRVVDGAWSAVALPSASGVSF